MNKTMLCPRKWKFHSNPSLYTILELFKTHTGISFQLLMVVSSHCNRNIDFVPIVHNQFLWPIHTLLHGTDSISPREFKAFQEKIDSTLELESQSENQNVEWWPVMAPVIWRESRDSLTLSLSQCCKYGACSTWCTYRRSKQEQHAPKGGRHSNSLCGCNISFHRIKGCCMVRSQPKQLL